MDIICGFLFITTDERRSLFLNVLSYEVYSTEPLCTCHSSAFTYMLYHLKNEVNIFCCNFNCNTDVTFI